MPPRRSATVTVEKDADETTEPAEPDKATLKDTILEVLGELGLTGDKKDDGTAKPTADEPAVEEIESPRQQESRMRQQVEAALPALHIHVDRDDRDDKKDAKPEPELTPGKKPFLQRMIGLNP